MSNKKEKIVKFDVSKVLTEDFDCDFNYSNEKENRRQKWAKRKK